MNKLLAIDTATPRASIALAVGDIIYTKTQDNVREHAQHILPIIEQLLSEAGESMKTLDGIVMGEGPGSFTGLRITCSIAKGLAYGQTLPIYPVSTLASIAESVFEREADCQQVLTVIDARMNEVYWDCYQRDGQHLGHQVSVMSGITLMYQAPFMLAGVGYEPYLSTLPQAIMQHCIKQAEVFPDAAAMIRLVRAGRISPVSIGEALPVYVRNQVVQGASGG